MNKYFNIMKRFYLILLMILTIIVSSCGTASYASRRTVNEMDEISYVLANYYPQLHEYYMEGVMDVTSLKEVVLEDGTVDYKVKYRFFRYYYRNYSDRMEALKLHFPELYEMYVSGVIEINSLYKYVEKNTGRIRHHCSYSRIYDYYYNYYPRLGGSHIYYRARPLPPAPRPAPRVQPNRPSQNPGNRPPQGGQPRVEPNRPPQGGQPNRPPQGGGNPNGGRPSRGRR